MLQSLSVFSVCPVLLRIVRSLFSRYLQLHSICINLMYRLYTSSLPLSISFSFHSSPLSMHFLLSLAYRPVHYVASFWFCSSAKFNSLSSALPPNFCEIWSDEPVGLQSPSCPPALPPSLPTPSLLTASPRKNIDHTPAPVDSGRCWARPSGVRSNCHTPIARNNGNYASPCPAGPRSPPPPARSDQPHSRHKPLCRKIPPILAGEWGPCARQ